MKKYILIIAVLLISYNGFTQETGEKKLGAWYTLAGSHKISNKVSITTLGQLRFYNATDNLGIGLALASVNYKFYPQLTGSIGYMRLKIDKTFEDLAEENDINENRLFEQIIFTDKIGKVNIKHRYMLEHRFLDLGSKTDFQQRMRYRLQFIIPLSKKLFINAYDEIILNLQGNLFSQNRLYGALGYKFNKNLNLQLGYLKHRFQTKSFDRLQVGVFLKTDFRKKK